MWRLLVNAAVAVRTPYATVFSRVHLQVFHVLLTRRCPEIASLRHSYLHVQIYAPVPLKERSFVRRDGIYREWKMKHFGTFFWSRRWEGQLTVNLTDVSATVAVRDADTQERSENVITETLCVARVRADWRKMSGEASDLMMVFKC